MPAAETNPVLGERLSELGPSRLLALLATGAPLPEVLRRLCLYAEELLPGGLAAVLLFNSRTSTLHVGAAPSLPGEYHRAVEGAVIQPNLDVYCGFSTDIENDSARTECRPYTLPFGLRASWSRPIADESGEFLGVFVVYFRETHTPTPADAEAFALCLHIVTIAMQRRQAEEKLAASEARLRHITEASVFGICFCTLDGRVLEANDASLRLVGLSRADLNTDRSRWDRLTPPEWREADAEAVRQLKATGVCQPYEKELWRSDGSRARVLLGATMMPDSTHAAVYITDITAQHAALESLMRSNSELQQFAYVISHDLREPLRAISSYTRLLTQRYGPKLDREAQEFLEYITSGSRRMAALIQDLLRYSRIINQEEQPWEEVPMNEVIAQALSNLHLAITDAGATVRHDGLPVVAGNPLLLGQLIQNLLENAIKYRSDAPLEVSISARRLGGQWRFSVRDNGIGIDASQHERIFGVFKRLHGQEVPGTGIGLALCKKIVELHGGRIWVDSEPGRGSNFCFTLPAATALP